MRIPILLCVFFAVSISLAAALTPITLSSPSPQASGWFGRAVASGDVNGDGRSDIVIGAPGECKVYVLNGVDRSFIYSLDNPSGIVPDCRFGRTISVGDVTGDGLADILVSNFGEDVEGRVSQGIAYLFDGASGTVRLRLDCPMPVVAAQFGVSTGLCDIDGDGLDEMVIGCGGLPNVYIFDGDGRLMNTITDPVSGGRFGQSLATGDANTDSTPDILVGDWSENVGGTPSGMVHVFDGRSLGLLFSLSSPRPQSTGYFGSSISLSDIMGDSRPEILVGSPLESGDRVASQGCVYIFSGDGTLLNQLTTPNPNVGCDRECNRFGVSVIGAHIQHREGSGKADVVVGANSEPVEGVAYQGTVYIYEMCTRSFVLLSEIHSPAPVETYGDPSMPNEVLFGDSLAAGDTSGNGYEDLLVGAFRADAGGPEEQGQAYLYISPISETDACGMPLTDIGGLTPGSSGTGGIGPGGDVVRYPPESIRDYYPPPPPETLAKEKINEAESGNVYSKLTDLSKEQELAELQKKQMEMEELQKKQMDKQAV